MSSEKVSSTTESPKIVRERRPITFGVLLSTRSIGIVIWRSTSSAAKPGYCVMTTTPGSEMSGYASSLSRWKLQSPAAAIARTPSSVTTR